MSVCQTVRICGTAQRTPPTVHATLLWFTTLARSRLLCRHLESWCLSSLGHLTRAGRNGFSNMTTDHLLLYMNHPVVLFSLTLERHCLTRVSIFISTFSSFPLLSTPIVFPETLCMQLLIRIDCIGILDS